MPNRFERRKQATRQALTQAAADLLLARGYDAVTVQDITDRADVGRGTFYIHFKDKEDIIWAILRDQFAPLGSLLPRTQPDLPFQQRIYYIWLTTFTHFYEHRDLVRAVFGDRGYLPIANRLSNYLVDMMIEDLTLNARDTTLNHPIPFIANYLTGAQMRIVMWWFQEAETRSPEQVAAMFYEMTIGSPAPGQKHR